MDFNVLNYPVVFSTPRRLTDVPSWHGLIPVAFALIALHRPRVFVELGTHKGDSYCAFCQAVDELKLATRCYAVDTWQGDPHAGWYGEEVYREFKAYHDPLYGGFSVLLRMTFDEALSHFADGEIDLLHIDGLHTYEAVKHDFESWLPKMSPRGVMVFHDVAVHEGDFGVWRLWQELSQRYPTRLFGFSHGLGIVVTGQEALVEGLGAWFAVNEAKWLSIQALFSALGERLQRQDQIRWLQEQLEGKNRELALAAEEMAKEHQEWERWSREKSSEIAALQAKLEQAEAVLQKQQTELAVKDRRLQQLEAAADTLEEILSSWLWRFLGRHLLATPEAILVSALAPVELVERVPLQLPDYVWPRIGKTVGGMRKLVRPLEVLGDRIASQGNALVVETGGRLLFCLDAGVEAAKIVLGVVGTQEVKLMVEFGELEGKIWHPFLQRKVRISPGRPCVLYLSLPKVAQTMAFAFSEAEQISFAQIAVLAISPLESRLGPWLWPFQQAAISLRHLVRRLLRGVKRYGWRGAISTARQRLVVGASDTFPPGLPAPFSAAGSQDPYAYAVEGKEKNLSGSRIAVLSSSGGNFFMGEIAKALAQAAEKLGAKVMLADERDKLDPLGVDWIVVVAPHEFFTLGKGVRRFSQLARRSERLLLLNTEQPQTQWFRTALEFFPAARAVLDLNYQTAVHLRRMGIRSYFVPISEVASEPAQGFPDHPALAWLPRAIRESVPRSYRERPLDVVFVGTSSPKRKAFFARHAGFFANLEACIYLPDGDKPFGPGDQRALDFAALSWLIRRAKIVLNLHRDDHPYLEWQRIVNLGILQQTLVISEHCDFCPALRANEDYLDLPQDLIPAVCAHYLAQPEEAERFALRAFSRVKTELAMERILACLFAELEGQ
jgi:hypothetical protein